MNKAKLSALCAKVRGYVQYDAREDAWDVPGEDRIIFKDEYSPIDDANQADDLLVYVADGREITTRSTPKSDLYTVTIWDRIGPSKGIVSTATSETHLREAKILCALRASGKVTDAEINDAMEEKK